MWLFGERIYRKNTSGAVIGLLLLVSLAQCGADGSVYRTTVEEGKKLLDKGVYDEALSVYGRWGDSMGRELLRRIDVALESGDKGGALALYEAYFEYFPFGILDWHGQWERWGKGAIQYTELRKEKNGFEGEHIAQDAAAVEVYREIMKLREEYKKEERFKKLVDEIVGKYPKSLFCPGAVISLGKFEHTKHGTAAGISIHEQYLKKMREADSPTRSIILVTLAYIEACTDYLNPPEERRKGIAACREVMEMTDITYEKLVNHLGAAEQYMCIKDEKSLTQARELFASFLIEYPNAYEARRARVGIVTSYLVAGKIEEALGALRDLESEAPSGTDFGEELHEMSKAYFEKDAYNKAIAILEEIVREFPTSANLTMAYFEMGEAYKKLRDEASMLSSYKKAAQLDSKFTSMNVMTIHHRNSAIESLGRYYMDKEGWAEALKYWEAWEPQSFCVSGLRAFHEERQRNIDACKEGLEKAD